MNLPFSLPHDLIDKNEPARWFVYRGEELLVQLTNREMLALETHTSAKSDLKITRIFYLGKQGVFHCFAVDVDADSEPPVDMIFQNLKESFSDVRDEDLLFMASKAKQILTWDKQSQFCSHCGAKTDFHSIERAKSCSVCHHLFYPQISPVVLVAITRGREILLARSPHFPPGVLSVLAGFVEPGESLEQAVHREVSEEVGIRIKNLRYFSSQPWPFPSNIMIGFTAEHDCGEIQIDGVEIEEAGWYTADTIPFLPKKMSLSRQLIDAFLA